MSASKEEIKQVLLHAADAYFPLSLITMPLVPLLFHLFTILTHTHSAYYLLLLLPPFPRNCTDFAEEKWNQRTWLIHQEKGLGNIIQEKPQSLILIQIWLKLEEKLSMLYTFIDLHHLITQTIMPYWVKEVTNTYMYNNYTIHLSPLLLYCIQSDFVFPYLFFI